MNSKHPFGAVLHAIAGVGPILFLAVATVEGATRSDYDWMARPISALALGPRGWVQALNFALLALAFLAFAVVTRNAFRRGVASVAAPILFIVMTTGVVVAGAFPMDAELAPPTLAGKLHGLGGFMVFPSIPVVVLVLSRRFRRDGEWRAYFGYSVATGSFCLALLVFFLLFVGPPGAPPLPASEFRGLVQRSLLLPFFTWMALVTLRAYRLTGGNFSRDAMAV